MTAPRVVEALNAALHRHLRERPGLHLLGEDLADPYGGAFKATRGLSTAHPGRVLSTPLSEAGIAGVAAGLALAGDSAIVEVMFGDFATLVFDQVANMVAKSVTMYGRTLPMPVLVRCPVGAGRGYGPTHSQSVQKHFLGVPNLALYETTPFHDPYDLIALGLDRGPAMLFEDKVLYTRRVLRDGDAGEGHGYRFLGAEPGWAHVFPDDLARADVVLLCPGGVVHRALRAARELRAHGVVAHLAVPARLHPLDLDPVLPLVDGALVVVAEESTPGGTWGAEVAAALTERAWGALRAPVVRLTSADSVIPAAAHLERQVVLGADHIVAAVRRAVAVLPTVPRLVAAAAVPGAEVVGALGTAAAVPGPEVAAASEPAGAPAGGAPSGTARSGHRITAPKLNNNDDTYLVLHWLVEDGAPVAPGTPVVELETSKAVEELLCEHAGFLRAHVEVGTEVPVGAHLATISPRAPEPADEPAPDAGGERFTAPGTASDRAAGAAPAGTAAALPTATSDLAPLGAAPAAHPPAATARTHLLDRVQQGTAAVVARAHREVPAAFTAVEVRVDRLLDRLARFSSDHDAEVGITEALVKAVAAAHPEFGLLFGSLVDDRTVALAPTPHVAITMDAGKGLYTPVVRDCADRPLIDLADDIMDLRVKAVRGSFSAAELTGATITISLNTGDDVLLAVPIVMWPQLAMVSLSATRTRLDLVDGELRQSRVVTLGLAYDHRAINGREASEFLRAVADSLREPERIDELLD